MNSQAAPSSSAYSLAAPTFLDHRRVLRALFELALSDLPAESGAVARLLAMRASEVAGILVQLDRLGLVRAERARLTLVGLATAARLPALQPQALPRLPRQVSAVRDASLPGQHEVYRPVSNDVLVAREPRRSRRTIRTGPSAVSL